MSTSVDNRIVQLTFDNKQFEQQVKQSMNSLKQLEETIKNGGSSGAAEKMGGAFSRIKEGLDFKGMSSSLDQIKNRFSTLGIVGMTVIQNLTNKAIDFVTKGLGAIKNALFTGGWQRAANLEQATFRLEGVIGNAKKVAEIMKNVDWAVTGTAYGLDEAAMAASMFAATGVKAGEDMKTTLRAVAGIAATFSQDFQQVSNVFTDAAASNNMLNDAMTRLQMLGVPARQVMADFLGTTAEKVKDLATDGKISFKQLAKAMDDAYGKHAQDANKTFTGALANMQTALKRLTADYYTDIRSGLRRIFLALKAFIGEYAGLLGKDSQIFKTFSSFRKYFTNNIISFISDLSKLNPFDALEKNGNVNFIVASLRSFINVIAALKNIMKSLQEGFYDVFDVRFSFLIKNAANNIARVTEKFFLWTTQSTFFRTVSRGIAKTIDTLIGVIKHLYNTFKGIVDIFKAVIDFAKPLIRVITSVTDGFRKMVDTTTQYLDKINIFGKIAAALRKGFDFILGAFGAAGTVVIDFLKNLGESMTSSFEDFIKFVLAIGILKRLKQAKTFFTTLSATAESFNTFLQDLNKTVDAIIKIPQKISSILTQIRKSLVEWQKSLKVAQLFGIAGALYITALAIKKLETIKGDQVATILTTIAGSLAFLTGALVVLDKVFNFKLNKPENIYDILDSLISHLPGGTEDGLISAGKTMLMMAGSVLILAKAMETLSSLDRGELVQSGIAIIALLGVMTLMAKLLSTETDGPFQGSKMTKGLTGLIAMAISVKILASVLKDLAVIPWDQLQQAVTALGLVLGIVAGYSIIMSRAGKDGGAVKVKSFILMAVSMKILGSALADLATIPWNELTNALTAMFFVLAMLAGFSKVTEGSSVGGGVGLVLMAASLILIAHALQQLAMVPFESLQEIAGVLILIFATLGVAMAAAEKFALGAVAMILMAGALNLLILPLVTLSAIPIDALMQSLLGLATALAIIGVGMAVFGAAIGPIVAGALALAAASVSLMIFAAACMGLGAAFSMLALGVEAIWKVFKLIVTDIVSFIKWIAEKISGFIDKITGATEKIDSKKMSKNSTKIGKDITSAIGKGFASGLKTLITSFISGGGEMIAGLIKGVGQKIRDVPKMIKEKIQEAKEKITGEKGNFESAGGSLVSGVASGIRGGLSSVISAVGSIASRALSSFKEKLGISSPSKEFAKASSWIAPGIVKGLRKTSYKVRNEVGSMATGMVDTMNAAITKSYSLLDDSGNLSPVITPTLDLSRIQNGVGVMNSMFSNRRIAASLMAGEISGSFNGNATSILLSKMMKTISKQNRPNENYVNNTFNVSGSDNPEAFANRVSRQLEMEMRAR